ncbi:sugar transferase [Sedimentitalea sp. HM32M-2]|uniref:sugar transferase n=1 Tax=Sedimentitalea sp. HM32M-2 TaxID=3351566 RepID=UPI00363183CD
MLDLAIVLLTLPVTLPLLVLTALLVSLDGSSPIYVQRRVGRQGRVFKMFKFRTMVSNADQALEAHLRDNPKARAEWDHSQKLREDPRVTRIGTMLRKCSLDELPQVLNVIIGDMSLIGPRPMMVDQTNLYPGRSYYWMRPGISGLWQVTDRNDTAFTARAQYDDKYFYNLSFANDCSILAKTFVVVFRATGY